MCDTLWISSNGDRLDVWAGIRCCGCGDLILPHAGHDCPADQQQASQE